MAEQFSRGRCKSALNLECEVVRMNVMPLIFRHLKDGFGMLATRLISKGKTIGAYHGLLVYSDHSKRPMSIKEYVKRTMKN